jgi:hypothetical protein
MPSSSSRSTRVRSEYRGGGEVSCCSGSRRPGAAPAPRRGPAALGDVVVALVLVPHGPVGAQEAVEALDLPGDPEGQRVLTLPPTTSAEMRSNTAAAIWVATVRFQISS